VATSRATTPRRWTTRGQIIVAAEIPTDGLDTAQLEPMISAAERELRGSGCWAALVCRAGRRRRPLGKKEQRPDQEAERA
jgi:hypothetical protein